MASFCSSKSLYTHISPETNFYYYKTKTPEMRLQGVSFFKKIVDLQFADFARDNPELFFEHAGEILRIFKT